jgi:superfamily II DNA or RNA helicase
MSDPVFRTAKELLAGSSFPTLQTPLPKPAAPADRTDGLEQTVLSTTIESTKTESIRTMKLNFPELRDMQKEALHAIIGAFNTGKKHCSVEVPVGVGKTLLSMALYDNLQRPDMLVVVPRIVLISNPWMKELEGIGFPTGVVGVYYGGEHEIRHPITIVVLHTLLRRPELIEEFKAGLCIIDEVQFLGSFKYGKILDSLKKVKYVVGVTGTISQAMRHNKQLAEELPVVFKRTIRDAREANALCSAVITPVYVSMTFDEKAEYDRLTRQYQGIMMGAHRAMGAERAKRMQQSQIFNRKRLTLLSNVESKFEATMRILRQDPTRPSLVFSEHLEALARLTEMMDGEGIASKTISYKITNKKERQQIIDGLGKKFFVLNSVGTLNVGFNVPQVSRAIIMASTTNKTQTEQRLGRVLRVDPNNPNKVAHVYIVIASGTQDERTLTNVKEAYNQLSTHTQKSSQQLPLPRLG